jgi:hypothetical protein|tara:strand:- start:499 stop:897 length:399 start_codon:yes stop_codon:yes gene_type:complete
MGQSPQPSDRQGPRGFGYVVITIVVIGGIVYGLNSLLHKESKTPPPDIQNAITNPVAPPTVSKAKLDQLRIGMGLAQVESVLGEGKLVTESKTASHVYTIYSWGENLNGPNLSVTFIDGKASDITADNLSAD